MPTARNGAQLNLRLPVQLKEVIEEAAAALGQSVSDFAVATPVQTARTVIQQRNTTALTAPDRDLFLAHLDDTAAKPNKALTAAASRYKKHLGR